MNLIILRKKNERLVQLEIDELGRAIKSIDSSGRRMSVIHMLNFNTEASFFFFFKLFTFGFFFLLCLKSNYYLSTFFWYFNEFFVLLCFTFFFYILTYEHGTRKEKYKKRKGKLNIIQRRLTHNYILTKKKTNETKTRYLLFDLHEKKVK